MDYIVLDTNCLVQCLSPRSKYYVLWTALEKGFYRLCVSNEILLEYAEIMERIGGLETSIMMIDRIISSPSTEFYNTYYNFYLIQSDPDDNKFVDCAIAAGAKFIVTEDNHFNILRQIDYPKVDIVGLDEFYDEIKVKLSIQ